jgi:integrase
MNEINVEKMTKYYKRAVRAFSKWIGRPATYDDLTEDNISRFMAETPCKPCTTKIWRTALRSLGKLPSARVRPSVPPNEIDNVLTLHGLLYVHYRPRRLLGKSPNTTRLYNNSIRKYTKWLGRDALVTDLTEEQVTDYLQSLYETDLSPHTVEKEYTQLTCLWRYASRRKFIETFPDIAAPTPPDPVPDAYSLAELQQLIEACRSTQGFIGNAPLSDFFEGLIRLILDTGERIGAVTKIRSTDITGEWLVVHGGNRKGRREGKRFKLGDSTIEILDRLSALGNPTLFFTGRDPCWLWAEYKRLLERAGLPTDRRGKFHKLRRTIATFYEAAGGNATELLGHSSRKVTEAYLDLRYCKTAQPCDVMKLLPE